MSAECQERTLFTYNCIICGEQTWGRGYDALMGEALEMVNALSRMTQLGIPCSVRIT